MLRYVEKAAADVIKVPNQLDLELINGEIIPGGPDLISDHLDIDLGLP